MPKARIPGAGLSKHSRFDLGPLKVFHAYQACRDTCLADSRLGRNGRDFGEGCRPPVGDARVYSTDRVIRLFGE